MLRTLADRATAASPLPLVTTPEARALGIRVASRHWLRVRPGVHVARESYLALPRWQRYAVRVHAFVRTHPRSVLCAESAAVLHGLPLFGEARSIHVLAGPGEKSRRFGDVEVHSSVDDRDVVDVDGIRCTTFLDTAVDLTRVLPPAKAVAVADAAIAPFQGGMLTRSSADAILDTQRSSRGRGRARWAWSASDEHAESPGESVSRVVIAWCGFETPELQRTFMYEDAIDRADFHFASCRVIGEADGWGKYGLTGTDDAALRLAEEKRREDRLRRHGHPVARWDLADAWRVTPLRSALLAAGVPLVRAPQQAMLASLRHSPREVATTHTQPR